MNPPPSPLPWKVDGLLILAADGTVVASVATHAPVSLAQLKTNAEVIVAAVNRDRNRTLARGVEAMAKRVDWMDFAHQLDKEREAIQDALPKGMTLHLSLSAYGYSAAEFSVHLSHKESGVSGYGAGRIPAKALESAKAELQKKAEEQKRRPRLVESSPKAIEG